MTNYEILKEYEAHQTPVPSYEEFETLKDLLKQAQVLLFDNHFIFYSKQKQLAIQVINEISEVLK